MKISIYVDTRRTDKNGLKNVFIRCYVNRNKVFHINTGIRCLYEPTECVFPKEERNHRAKSGKLAGIFYKCDDFIYRNPNLTVEQQRQGLLEIIKGVEKQNVTLSENILDFSSTKNKGTKGIYELTSRKVNEYDKNANFDSVDEKWLTGFRKHFIDKGMSANGISIHLRNIRTVFNYARRKRITENYPFLWFKIEEEETIPNNLSVEQIRLLRDYKVESWQEVYRDLFMLSFYLAGVNVGDLLLCKKLTNGRFIYKRQKTGKMIDIYVCKEAKSIIKKYKGKDFLLSVMDGRADYHSFMKRWNQALKKIGTKEIIPDKAGEKRKIVYNPLFPDITTYTARYSFASIAANDLEISENLIGRCLGHSWSKTVTNRYIANDQKKVDEVIKRVADYVNEDLVKAE